jgi:hypothetical protein
MSIFLARKIETDTSFIDFLLRSIFFTDHLSFLLGWITWNMVYSIVILIIGTVRTFLLGFVHDYKK